MKTTHGARPASARYEGLSFGPFRLDLVQRVLRRGDEHLRLGSRALEILITLAQRAGEVVSKNELIARVWPKSVVQEATLRVHITALRKALGDGGSGNRYIENFSGRGYRFVAPVIRRHNASLPVKGLSALYSRDREGLTTPRSDNLPAPPTWIIGRAQVVDTLVARTPQQGFLTIVGPGGMGKTTVALTVADQLSAQYEHGVRFVDLSMLTEATSVPRALAAALGLTSAAADPVPDILTFLRDKSMLLVLDNCEHLIGSAASLAEKILQGTPRVHLLATSREPLRAESEFVHRLLPLESPASDTPLTRSEAMAFPAVQLFVEQAMADVDTFDLSDADIPVVAQICLRLDGNPLALKLAAARVDTLGVRGLATGLDNCLQLLTRGRRTASPRHQTLRATLDWSYELLSPSEQAMLRCLAVFPSSFDLESADALVTNEGVRTLNLFDILTDLVSKSMMTASAAGERALYRLPQTTRAYALEKLRDSGELARVTERHMGMCNNERLGSCRDA